MKFEGTKWRRSSKEKTSGLTHRATQAERNNYYYLHVFSALNVYYLQDPRVH